MDMSKVDFERTGCLNGTLEPNQRVFETTCELPHSFEVFASFALPTTPDSAYPRGLAEAASAFCAASYDSYGRSSWLRGQNIRLTALPPSAPRWNSHSDFRNVVYCAVSPVDGGMMSESDLKNR